MGIDISLLKKLRAETAASIADCRRALEESEGKYEKAVEWLRRHGIKKAGEKKERATSQGIIHAYIHQNKRIGAMVELACETDFVARTDEFDHLANELAMQVAAMNPKDVESLLKQEYIRDASKTVSNLVKETIAKVGENIVVKRFERFTI